MGCGASKKDKNNEVHDYKGVNEAWGEGDSKNKNNGDAVTPSAERQRVADSAGDTQTARRGTIVFESTQMQQGCLRDEHDYGSSAEFILSQETTAQPTPVGLSLGSSQVSKLDSNVLQTMNFSLLHFNDVYHITQSQKEPVGGAARFTHAVKQFKAKYDSHLLFSGDCYNPSLMSTVTKGRHMVPILNELEMTCAVYGNHDFDFGVEELSKLTGLSNCPWLMTNIIDIRTGKPAAEGLSHLVFTATDRNTKLPIKVGVIGIGEEEWLSCVKDLPAYIEYRDAVETARSELKILKEKGCQVTIALTHMRHNNDLDFIKQLPELDMLLGGHDHFYRSEVLESGQLVLKSGTDFKNLSFVAVELIEGSRPKFTVERIDITSDVLPDKTTADVVASYETSLFEKISKELCHLETTLDITTESVRTAESSMGNFVSDLMRSHMEADLAFVNSGILRADVIYHPGPLTIKDILDMVPIEDVVVLIEITGAQVLAALENGLSKWPQHEGRFLQVSGLQLNANPELSPGSRITEVYINGELMEPTKLYKCATTAFLCKGCDGFTSLKDSRFLIDHENGPVLPTLIRRSIEGMVPKEVQVMKKESTQKLLKERNSEDIMTKTDKEHMDTEIKQLRRAYLPTICPVVEGRIVLAGVISEEKMADSPFALPSSIPAVVSRPGTPNSRPPVHTRTNSADVSGLPTGYPVGVLTRDIAVIKTAFKELSLRLPSSAIEWTIDMLPYLGQSGQIVNNYPDIGILQVRFNDGKEYWFPCPCFNEEGIPDRAGAVTPPIMSSAPTQPLRLPQRPSTQMGNRRQPLTRSQTMFPTNLKRDLVVPTERTLSFIFRPVSYEDTITKKDVQERGKKSHKSEEDLGWSTFSDRKPAVVGTSLSDMVWAGDAEGVEAFLASGNTKQVNRKAIGEPESWSQHSDGHVSFGLGTSEMRAYPVHYAAVRGHLDVLQILLDNGGNLHCKSDVGFTPRETVCARLTIAMLHNKQKEIEKMREALKFMDTYSKTETVIIDKTAEET
eukprot:TRINITY_DN4249_c1_g1_i1.p1 TRINITY_DN4249_c1_g1~~TRINITY_DN4249_c1_g1_i1.p1  ORF type:complete len:1017 (+),score=181.89 TRINITY_DN4249_c1_g1_i1:48-3098(+)